MGAAPTPPSPPRPVTALERLIATHMHCRPGKTRESPMTCGRPYPDTSGDRVAFRTAHLADTLTAAGLTLTTTQETRP